MNDLTSITVGRIILDGKGSIVDATVEILRFPGLHAFFNLSEKEELLSFKDTLKTAVEDAIASLAIVNGAPARRLVWDNEFELIAELKPIGKLYELTIRQRRPFLQYQETLSPEIQQMIVELFPILPVGIVIADAATGQFLFANSFVANLFEYSVEDFKKLSPAQIHPEDTLEIVFSLFNACARGEVSKVQDLPAITGTGKKLFVDIQALEILYNGQMAVCGIFQENTQRHLEKERVLKANSFLDISHFEQSGQHPLSSMGNWVYEVKEDFLWWSPEVYVLFGQQEATYTPAYSSFFLQVHPADRDRVESTYKTHLQNGQPFSISHRILLPNAQTRYIQLQCSTLFDDDHKPLRSFGLMTDITAMKLSEMALKETNLNFQRIAENINEVFLLTDKDNKSILFANRAFQEVLGLSRDVLLEGISLFRSRLFLEDLPVFDALQHTVRSAESAEAEVRLVQKDLALQWLQFKVKHIKGEYGETDGVIYIIVDITARKNAELEAAKSLQAQEILTRISNRFIHLQPHHYDAAIQESFAEIGPTLDVDRIYLFDIDWEHQSVSNTHEWCSSGIVPQITYLQNYPVQEMEFWMRHFKHGETYKIDDIEALAKDSAEWNALFVQGIRSLITVPLMQGEVCMGFMGFDYVKRVKTSFGREEKILRVFSELIVNLRRKNSTEQKLIEQGRFLNDLMDSSTAIIFEKDLAGSYKRVNKAWEKATGLLVENVLGKTDFDLFDSATALQFSSNDQKVIKSGLAFFTEERIANSSKQQFFVSAKFPVYDHKGIIKGVAAVVTEITNIKKAELELAKREANLEAIINSSVEAIWSVDGSYNVIYANQVFKSNFETAHGVKITAGMCLADIIPAKRWTFLKPYYDKVLRQGKPVTFLNNVLLKGINKTLDVHMKPVTLYGQVHGVAVFSLNITERLKAEEALKKSEQRFRTLFEQSTTVMLLLDPDTGIIIDANAVAHNFFEREALKGSVVGTPFFSYVKEEAFQLFDLTSSVQAGSLQQEIELFLPGGVKLQVAIFGTYLVQGEQPVVHLIVQDITDKKLFFDKLAQQIVNLREIAWMQSHVFRAPLARAMGLMILLQDAYNTEADKQEVAQLMDFMNGSLAEMDTVVRSISDKINEFVKEKPE